MKTRIMYLRDNNNPHGRGNPIGCLAIGLDSVDSPTKISYQVSVVNPLDTFDRKLAVLKANAKLQGQPFTLKADVYLDEDFSSHEVASVVMSHLKNNKDVPSRARRAAVRWLANASKLKTVNNLKEVWSLAVEQG